MPSSQDRGMNARQWEALVRMLGAIVSEYMTFLALQAPEDAKAFAARHAAGKAAVGHFTALSKLLHGSLSAMDVPHSSEDPTMGEMLAAAREAMSRYDDGEDNDE